LKFKVIADSCCDTTDKIRQDLELELVPLKILLAQDIEYLDSLDLDVSAMIDEMNQSASVKTACPSIEDYVEYMHRYDNLFIVTIAHFLSGSYNAAIAARELVLEEFPDKTIHVFDSLNASAGELNIVLFINSLISKGLSFEEIIVETNTYINSLVTLFVLEDLSNMIKNGRMSRITERVASILNIYPVLGKRDTNEIRMMAKVRGLSNAFDRMTESVSRWTEELPAESIIVTLSHCDAAVRAATIKENILMSCSAAKDVIIVPTSGVSSVYANRGGIVVSFQTKVY